MKVKTFTITLMIIALLAIGYTFNYKFSQAQQAAQPTEAPKECDKDIKDKLNQVLSNQADIISRLGDLDRLVRTRKGD